jgi:hypothetical protein
MPADERIKVIFKTIFVRNSADITSTGEFYFIARAGNVSIGNRNRIFNAVEGRTFRLPQPEWSGIVDVRNLSQVVVSFQGKDEDDLSADDDLGTIQHTLRFPYRQQSFMHGTGYYLLEWEVQLVVGGVFGRHPPDAVFATRQHTGSLTCTTVSGNSFPARMEMHPVRPVPIPPPAAVLPARPAFPGGAPPPELNEGNTLVAVNSPVNIIPNPAVIPVLGPPTAAPVGPHTDDVLDSANWANARNCARIEYTWYRPNTLSLTDNDARLEWRAVPLPPPAGGPAAGAAMFFDPATGISRATGRGRRVLVHGTAEGDVQLEVRFQGALFATYRAIVRQVRRIPCRITILNGNTPNSTPRATPDDARNHLAVANRFLWQMALELTLDTDPARTHGATPTTIPGIFRIRVSPGATRNVANTRAATIRNHRAGVMNFVYIHSDAGGNLGAATDYPASTAAAGVGAAPVTAGRPVVNDAGTPSGSWARRTGVGIGADATADPVNTTLLAANQRPWPGPGPRTLIAAMYLTDGNGGALVPVGNHATPARQREYANTMAHEFGHILNLGHRVEGVPPPPGSPAGTLSRDMTAADPVANLVEGGIFWDGLLHPPHQNVMQWWDPSAIAQDFDIVQARAAHLSPLVTGAPALPPAAPPPPGPAPPRRPPGTTEYVIQSGDYLSKIAQRYGMTWQQLYNYDGGTGVPNRQRLRSGDPDLIYPGEVIVVPEAGA